MADDKPKHKPQAKRTLEEVLRSLKDLVRNDLSGGRGAAPGAPPRASAGDEPESFNEALSRLDEIIDEKIVRPVRAPAPPAPPRKEPTIDWDEPADAPGGEQATAGDAASDAAPTPAHAPESYPDSGWPDPGDPEPSSPAQPRAEEDAKPPEADDSALAALEGIELGPPGIGAPGSDERPGAQELFSFPEGDPDAQGAPILDHRRPESVDGVPSLLDANLLDTPQESTGDTGDAQTTEAAAMPGDSHELAFEPEPPPFAMSSGRDENRHGRRPGAGTDDARARSGDAHMSRPAEPARPTPDASRGMHGGPEPPTLEEEIPVLQDVAPGAAPRSEGLPDTAHARDIAIRVIARINIERRKAGETPLDIKTIERLQRYLTEALTKAASGRPK